MEQETRTLAKIVSFSRLLQLEQEIKAYQLSILARERYHNLKATRPKVGRIGKVWLRNILIKSIKCSAKRIKQKG